jgi:RHS repeat-associated protein
MTITNEQPKPLGRLSWSGAMSRSSERGVRPESKSPEGREPLLRCAGLGSRICFALALAGYFDSDDFDGTGPESSAGTAPAIPVARRIAASASTGTGITTFSTEPRRYSLYSPEMTLLAETEHTTSATPPIQYEYVWFAGAPVAQLTYSVPSEPLAATEVVWTVTDHLGTPKLQTGAAGEIVWHAEHEPYGQVYVLRAGEGRHQPLRFPGQEAEQLGVNAQNGVSDRSYNIFRWYRPGGGRYSQADPLNVAASLNIYGYVDGNPVTFYDREGLIKGKDSSCGGAGFECCGSAIDQGIKKFNDFFKPGWKDRNPSCWKKIQEMGSKLSIPFKGSQHTPLTCMTQYTKGMSVKCAKSPGGNPVFGGPPGNIGFDPNIIWIQSDACANKNMNNFMFKTIFHEALHNCGAPPDAGPFKSTMAYDITSTCIP